MNHAQTQPSGAEYTIYTFERPIKKTKGDIVWKKHATSEDAHTALSEAQNLYDSRKFHKIEVKKKFFDPRKNRSVDQTFKVFGNRGKSDMRKVMMIGVMVLCVVGGFAASYLLGSQ